MTLGRWALTFGAVGAVWTIAGMGLIGPVLGLSVNGGLLFGLIGFVLGIVGLRRNRPNRRAAAAGLLLGLLALVLILVF